MADGAPVGEQILSVEGVPFEHGQSVSPVLHDLAVRLKWSRLFQARALDGSLVGTALLARSDTAHNLKFDTADVWAARALSQHASMLLRRIGYSRLRSWDSVPEASADLAFLT
ncbi:MAG: hypothetical protein AAF526_03625, partial [Pseudomonadota bacterium]